MTDQNTSEARPISAISAIAVSPRGNSLEDYSFDENEEYDHYMSMGSQFDAMPEDVYYEQQES